MTPADRLKEIKNQFQSCKSPFSGCSGGLYLGIGFDMEWLISRVEAAEKLAEALSAFVFDEQIPDVGKSYWLDQHDLKDAKQALEEWGREA